MGCQAGLNRHPYTFSPGGGVPVGEPEGETVGDSVGDGGIVGDAVGSVEAGGVKTGNKIGGQNVQKVFKVEVVKARKEGGGRL